jgi:hypothetical protein
VASQQSAHQAPCDCSWRRNHGGERNCSHRQRSKLVPVWARVRGLARHDAAPEFFGPQGAAGANQQTGDKYIRSLLVAGAVAVLRHARERATKDGEWVRAMLARKPAKLVAVALANRTARIVWAVTARGDGYQAKEIVRQAA